MGEMAVDILGKDRWYQCICVCRGEKWIPLRHAGDLSIQIPCCYILILMEKKMHE